MKTTGNNAKQGMYWRVSRYYPMIHIGDYIVDAVFGEIMPYRVIADAAPSGIAPAIYFDEWCDITYEGIGGVEDYMDIVYNHYSREEIAELAKKFDFFTKF